MSSDKPLEVFFDRSLGKQSAQLLRDAGWVVHLIADYYPEDAASVPDDQWIIEGCRRGWLLLTKDRRIRYRAQELESLRDGHLFCLADGNLGFEEVAARFVAAERSLRRVRERGGASFWHVYAAGRVKLMWGR